MKRTYIADGCDQQGRQETGQHAPAPAEAATDMGIADTAPGDLAFMQHMNGVRGAAKYLLVAIALVSLAALVAFLPR